MEAFSWLPDMLQHALVSVVGLFVGEGWHLKLGALFMIIVIFLPGGLMEGIARIGNMIRRRRKPKPVTTTEAETAASE
jgi:hypothetical protein